MFKFSHFITRKLDSNLLRFKQRNCKTESIILVGKIPKIHWVNFRKSNIVCCSYAKSFDLLLY